MGAYLDTTGTEGKKKTGWMLGPAARIATHSTVVFFFFFFGVNGPLHHIPLMLNSGKHAGNTILQSAPQTNSGHGPLSCWNIPSLWVYMTSMKGCNCSPSSEMVNEMLRWTTGTNPYDENTPHTTMEPPPACTVPS